MPGKPKPNNAESGMEDKDWDTLLRMIDSGQCTPFLGARVNSGILPLGAELAVKLAEEFDCPLQDCKDLARVAQFVALDRTNPLIPRLSVKKLIAKEIEQRNIPDLLNDPEQPLNLLAKLPLPIYMTTNYDNLMFRALQANKKLPKQEICRWNSNLENEPSVFETDNDFEPGEITPLVFHLHGYDELGQSMVLTEDDYVDFLVNLSMDQENKVIPPRIQRAMTRASLLFIGYALEDWNFRVILRWLVGSMEQGLRPASVSVQLIPRDSEERILDGVKEYLRKYFLHLNIKIYWGTAQDFMAELRTRWES